MQRTFLLSLLAIGLIATGGFALAQNAAPNASPAPAAKAAKWGQHGWMKHAGFQPGMHRHMEHRGGAVGAVLSDLRMISRLYVMEGRTSELPSLYNEVLGKTRNPLVRHFVYRALARAQMRPRGSAAAIATLRKDLDENLARLDSSMPQSR